jgi:CRP-like cAMP-binding protein
MDLANFARGQVLFREGGPADSVFRLLSGAVDLRRELDGAPSFSAWLVQGGP